MTPIMDAGEFLLHLNDAIRGLGARRLQKTQNDRLPFSGGEARCRLHTS